MKSTDIRNSFIDYFASCGHQPRDSSPLVPHGDPTLLFTNAGMVQFKDFFVGRETPPSSRAVTVQKCLRVSGKHNDLENVGPSPRHHTFFEMLGNFSFGDYFKAEAIEMAWELVTDVWGLDPVHLQATVFEEDDEAESLWRKISTLPADRIHRCGAKDNFWAMGDTGPCGPCSEIFIDRFPDRPAVDFVVGSESGRYLEIWNLVFMQFERSADGVMSPLPDPSIDTGAGLERVAATLQDVTSNYDTDLFRPIIAAAAEISGHPYRGSDDESDIAMRVIADHLRAVGFLLADGVIPSNEGRGYVLRRILRRALRHGMRLGFEEPFLYRLVPVLGEVMDSAYPELAATRAATLQTVQAEEEKFLSTIATGARQVQVAVEAGRAAGEQQLDGPTVFRLYDTYGLPLEVIEEIAEEERMAIDQSGFESALDEQRRRSREATGDGQKRLAAVRELVGRSGAAEPTQFEGNEDRIAGVRPLRFIRQIGRQPELATSLQVGDEGIVFFPRTVFYAEGGGQVGDVGEILWPGGRAEVLDTQKDTSGNFYHSVRIRAGELTLDQEVELHIAEERRRDIERNHTATHLLHAALRSVLGETVRQAGSLVEADRLRFDFTFSRPLTLDERHQVEDIVNHWVRRASPVTIVVQSQEAALARGAMALFGEKYGDEVRTVEVAGFSLELCGGCHVGNTGEIGAFLLVAERGVASGVRRVEALSGRGAAVAWRAMEGRETAIVESAGVPIDRVGEEIESLRKRAKEAEKELAAVRRQMIAGGAVDDESPVVQVEGVNLLAREVPFAPAEELRDMADILRQKLQSGVVVIGSRGEDKVGLVVAVSSDLVPRVHAGRLIKALAPRVGGGGGGRPEFAQAGGKSPQGLDEALEAAAEELRNQLLLQ
jgi:alanyl-tRNA synthetase